LVLSYVFIWPFAPFVLFVPFGAFNVAAHCHISVFPKHLPKILHGGTLWFRSKDSVKKQNPLPEQDCPAKGYTVDDV
jgi:hypothetical protein